MQISKNENIDNSPFRYLDKAIDIYTRVTLPDISCTLGKLWCTYDSQSHRSSSKLSSRLLCFNIDSTL